MEDPLAGDERLLSHCPFGSEILGEPLGGRGDGLIRKRLVVGQYELEYSRLWSRVRNPRSTTM